MGWAIRRWVRSHIGEALFALLALAALGLPQLVRAAPFAPALPFEPFRLDGLGAFFSALALLGGIAALLAGERPRRVALVGAGLLVAFAADPLPLTALGLAMAAFANKGTEERGQGLGKVLDRGEGTGDRGQGLGKVLYPFKTWTNRSQLKRKVPSLTSVPYPLAPTLLLIGAVLLKQGGSWRFSSPLAGAGMGALSFALVLAAALLGLIRETQPASATRIGVLLLAPAWAYPLLRLYAFGPWNNGWHVAALLLSGALLLWAALTSLAVDGEARAHLALRSLLSAALLSAALGSSAGIAAGAYALLSYLLLAVATSAGQAPADGVVSAKADAAHLALPVVERPAEEATGSLGATPAPWYTNWLLSPAVPLTAPFVAAWLGVGAAVASATPLTALVAWLGALLTGLTLLLGRRPGQAAGWLLGGLSLAGGVLSPLLIELLIEPMVEQLQGGLSPFGELTVWPWVGLAMLDSQRRQVATLPSLLVGGLLVVLMAIMHLLARLLGPSAQGQAPPQEAVLDDEPPLWELVRRELFWLGGRGRSD